MTMLSPANCCMHPLPPPTLMDSEQGQVIALVPSIPQLRWEGWLRLRPKKTPMSLKSSLGVGPFCKFHFSVEKNCSDVGEVRRFPLGDAVSTTN